MIAFVQFVTVGSPEHGEGFCTEYFPFLTKELQHFQRLILRLEELGHWWTLQSSNVILILYH